MAASSVITARPGARADRGLIARTAARTAPRGPGLAPVVALPIRTTAVATTTSPAPALRLVPAPRRAVVGRARPLVLLTAAVLLLAVLFGSARVVLADPVMPVAAGHVVLEPGETLWDVAVRSAPNGVDPREQLDALRRLNGFGPGALDAWTVVLIPAS